MKPAREAANGKFSAGEEVRETIDGIDAPALHNQSNIRQAHPAGGVTPQSQRRLSGMTDTNNTAIADGVTPLAPGATMTSPSSRRDASCCAARCRPTP